MTFTWETRQSWGAKPPKHRRTDVNPQGIVVHWPGPGQYAGQPHAHCRSVMRAWQKYHMSRGSNDLEYGLVLCTHLRLMEARIEQDRTNIRVGSNGTAEANRLNSSIQLMRGVGDGPPTRAEIDALADAIVWLRAAGGWGPRITGHRDHTSTSCPGNELYNELGTIRRKVTQQEDDDMKAFRDWTGKTTTVREIPNDGQWHNVPGMGRLGGAPFDNGDEKHTFYCRFLPDWSDDLARDPLTIKWRWVRDGGTPGDPSDDDATGHDTRQFAAGTGSIPLRGYHDEVGDKGVGGRWQFKVTGATKVEIGTRYAKMVSREVNWV